MTFGLQCDKAQSRALMDKALLLRSFECDLLPMCAEEGIAVITYNPLAGGMLTGKHDRKAPRPPAPVSPLAPPPDANQERYWNEKEFETIEALRPIAAEAGNSMATMALSWVLANPAITAPVVGASRPEQLAESLAAREIPLSVDLRTRLDDLIHGWRMVDADQ
jgi:1-deoxyxylulose-5-phosphate synthase